MYITLDLDVSLPSWRNVGVPNSLHCFEPVLVWEMKSFAYVSKAMDSACMLSNPVLARNEVNCKQQQKQEENNISYR